MLELAVHIVESKKGKFEPEKFEDEEADSKTALKGSEEAAGQAGGKADRAAEKSRIEA